MYITTLSDADAKVAATLSGEPLFQGQLPKEETFGLTRVFTSRWKLRFCRLYFDRLEYGKWSKTGRLVFRKHSPFAFDFFFEVIALIRWHVHTCSVSCRVFPGECLGGGLWPEWNRSARGEKVAPTFKAVHTPPLNLKFPRLHQITIKTRASEEAPWAVARLIDDPMCVTLPVLRSIQTRTHARSIVSSKS